MLENDKISEIHRLFKTGVSQRNIALKLGISRNTVARYIHHPVPKRNRNTVPIKKKAPFQNFYNFYNNGNAIPDTSTLSSAYKKYRQYCKERGINHIGMSTFYKYFHLL